MSGYRQIDDADDEAARKAELAVRGGPKVRPDPLPARQAFGEAEVAMIDEVVAYYRERNADPGYQGHFEKRYTEAFVDTLSGGYADAVATGTAALYVAIAALELPKGGEVLVSPITDPGTLSAIILNGLKPRLIDSRPGSYNTGAAEFEARITPETVGAVIVHSIGQACDIAGIMPVARRHGIRVVEDCSQAHGAKLGGQFVGSYGDIAAFSTMYRKAHITGACGGVVYSRDLELFRRALAHADRGKPSWLPGFDDRNPNGFLFPALNLHTDEISCAIGIASLKRLNATIVGRLSFVSEFAFHLKEQSKLCRPYAYSPADSPFVFPVIVDSAKLRCTKREFAEAVIAEGIGLNPHYEYVVADWPWIKPHLADGFDTPNARAIRDQSFAVYVNEHYGDREVRDTVNAIVKVERAMAV
ncbi:MAG: DegT/DnrJ/EryC1/StrS family aminotransferase [Gammaproteobacteria bacterium]|nr:DegT/DnrJ/EryC1/StrS family aminotransferase [Gammaproteobacteria bacterium]